MTLEELQVLITVAVEESGGLDELASSIRRTAQEAQQQTEKSAAAQSAAWASLAAAAGVTFSKIRGHPDGARASGAAERGASRPATPTPPPCRGWKSVSSAQTHRRGSDAGSAGRGDGRVFRLHRRRDSL